MGNWQSCEGSVDRAVVNDWKEGQLKQLQEKYRPEDIYNADETGLFLQMLPENSFGFKGESYHGRDERWRPCYMLYF